MCQRFSRAKALVYMYRCISWGILITRVHLTIEDTSWYTLQQKQKVKQHNTTNKHLWKSPHHTLPLPHCWSPIWSGRAFQSTLLGSASHTWTSGWTSCPGEESVMSFCELFRKHAVILHFKAVYVKILIARLLIGCSLYMHEQSTNHISLIKQACMCCFEHA